MQFFEICFGFHISVFMYESSHTLKKNTFDSVFLLFRYYFSINQTGIYKEVIIRSFLKFLFAFYLS